MRQFFAAGNAAAKEFEMKLIVEVKQLTGDVRSGNAKATGKPYKMAEQEVAVFIPGSEYPVVGKRDIYVPQDKQSGTFGEPEWMKPGRYSVDLKIRADRFNRIEPVIDWRHAQPQPDIPARKVA